MKVWITKSALTKGIIEREAELIWNENLSNTSTTNTSTIEWGVAGEWTNYYHGQEWHRTKGAAVVRAETMRHAKIAALRKQIARLEKLKW